MPREAWRESLRPRILAAQAVLAAVGRSDLVHRAGLIEHAAQLSCQSRDGWM